MKKKSGLKGLVIIGAVALMNVSFMNKKVTIYHQAGPNNWVMLCVSYNALGGHSNHGDIYASSYCPVSGPEWGCR